MKHFLFSAFPTYLFVLLWSKSLLHVRHKMSVLIWARQVFTLRPDDWSPSIAGCECRRRFSRIMTCWRLLFVIDLSRCYLSGIIWKTNTELYTYTHMHRHSEAARTLISCCWSSCSAPQSTNDNDDNGEIGWMHILFNSLLGKASTALHWQTTPITSNVLHWCEIS